MEEETTTAADRNLGVDLAGMIARAHTHVNTSWAFDGVGNGNGSSHGGNAEILTEAERGTGNGPMVDLAFTKGGGRLRPGGVQRRRVRIRVFGGAQTASASARSA